KDQLQFLTPRLREWQHRHHLQRHHRALLARLAAYGTPSKIVFLCSGNICRSPFAARLAEQLLPQAQIVSAGFHSLDGRACPGKMLRVSRLFGVDLSPHRSHRITQDQIEGADLVLAMDPTQIEELRDLFPEALPRTGLLGLFAQPAIFSIPDPYLADEEETLRVCKVVRSAVQGLADSQRAIGQPYEARRESMPVPSPHPQ